MNISIVICTYNPDPAIIKGLYDSVTALKWPDGVEKEILLIDNASTEPLADHPDVINWQAKTAGIRVIRENKPGLSNARMRAFNEAKGEYIIFFDDDNKPSENYIEAFTKIVKEYPFVGIWGPGNVYVQWMPGGNREIQKHFKHIYQEHSQDKVTFALDFISPSTMPYGTGMILKKEVAREYVKWSAEKTRKTTGRIGKSLTGYEDIQICWLGMEAGWAVGRHPELKVTHVIAANKIQWDYLGRLLYGSNSSYASALKEALPHRFKNEIPSSPRLAFYLMYHFLAWLTKKGAPPLKIYVAKHLGQPVGAWKAADMEPPWWIKKITENLYGSV